MRDDNCIFCKIVNGDIPSKMLYEDGESKVMLLAKKMAFQMTDKLECDGFNLVQNNGEAAGQTVFHFHLHLIPRYNGDGQTLGWKELELTADELEEIKKIITE